MGAGLTGGGAHPAHARVAPRPRHQPGAGGTVGHVGLAAARWTPYGNGSRGHGRHAVCLRRTGERDAAGETT